MNHRSCILKTKSIRARSTRFAAFLGNERKIPGKRQITRVFSSIYFLFCRKLFQEGLSHAPAGACLARAALKHTQIPVYAGNAAFFLVLSFLPLLTLLLGILQYTVFGPEDLLEILSRIMPDEVLPLFDDFLQKLYPKSGAAVISVSAVTAWSASNGIYGMARGLGAVLDVKETRSYVHMRLLCLFYMLLFVLGLVLTLLLHVFGRKLLSVFTARALPLARTLSFLLEHLQLYSFFLLTALFSLLYLALPNRKQKLSRVLPGALAAAGAWLLFSALFSVYVNHFAKGLALYGSLTTMVLTMLWVYACVSIVFYGAFLNRLLAQCRQNRT